MIESYGEVIIKKGTILYHTTNEIFTYKSLESNPMLFCTFHPSEWYYGEEYITFIRLKKDISLFFMIDFNEKSKSSSYLSKFTKNKIDLLKITHTNNQLLYYYNELKRNNFDGWFNANAIDKAFIEVGLLNETSIFEELKTEKLKKDWTRQNNANNKVTFKNWGIHYAICKEVIFKLNERYKKNIEKYIENTIKDKFYIRYTLQILLLNSKINYHKGEWKEIEWNVFNTS
jgi:hypothetical protein